MAEIKMGDMVRDKVTGFTGKVIGYHNWLNGCTTCTVQPTSIDKDGQPIKSHSFDLPQLELVTESAPVEKKSAGGPHDEPTRTLAP